MRTSSHRDSANATLLGIAALVLWASLVAVARGVRETMGVVPSAAVANLVGGMVALTVGPGKSGRLRRLLRLPPKYLLGCGGLFVLYNLALFPAIERAATHRQTVDIALINYLWPALSVLGTVIILRKRASGWLWLGLVTATVGAFWAVSRGSFSWASLHAGVVANPWPYVLALVAAISWALYSTLTRRWAGQATDNAAPLFLMATGIGLFILHSASSNYLRFPLNLSTIAQLAYFTLCPTMLAYVFWDRAMRRGNIVLVTSLSFFTPVMSTLISCAYLGVPMGRDLLVASGLVVVGAWICNRSIRN